MSGKPGRSGGKRKNSGGARPGAGRPKKLREQESDNKTNGAKRYRMVDVNLNLVSAKICIDCGQMTSLMDFYLHRAMKDGRFNVCKICARIRSRKYIVVNKEAQRERVKKRDERLQQVLPDRYVEKLLNMKSGTAPLTLIEMRREQIYFKRALAQLNKLIMQIKKGTNYVTPN